MKQHLHVIVTCVALAFAVSACGSAGNGQGNGQANGGVATQQNGEGAVPGGGPGGGGPGGSGKVAAVSGNTAQVQGSGAQVAVTWNAKTTFTQQVSVTAKDLKVGDCVAAMPSMGGATGSSEDTSTVAAATVRISTPVGGSCTGGMRTPGTGPRVEQGNPPEGAPSGQARRGGMGAIGKVTAINGSGFTVASVRPGSDDAAAVAVTTSASTAWTASAKATSKDVRVGRCVVSFGEADSTGAITAASIAVSQPVNGQCAQMFGGPGMGRPGGSGQTS